MNEPRMIGIIAALMVLVILFGGLVRRRMPAGQGIRLALIWAAIILAAALIAALGQNLMR